jgi:PAS domain S-box-containing protein
LQQFIEVSNQLPYSSIIIVSPDQDEELCLLALEAGAEDSVIENSFTPAYIRKAILLSLRRNRTEMEIARSREQLFACIQNTPNVAVQWYNGKGEVLFWNKASEHLFGYAAKYAVGKTLDQLILTHKDETLWLNKIRYVATEPQPGEPQEWSYRRPDGSEGCCISTLFPIPSFNDEAWFVCMDVDITDRKEMEKALLESEERYHTIFNQASDAIFINDDKGQLLDMNQRAYDLLRYSREELIRMNVIDLFSSEELAGRPIMREKFVEGQRIAIERNMLHSSGINVPVEITAQRFTDGRTMAIVRNVTERKKGEEALKQSEEKYRSLVEQQADAITIFDEKGHILDVNTSATHLLQYTKDEYQRMTIMDILSPGEIEKNPLRYGSLKNGESTINQRKLRRKDGSYVESEVHTKRLFDGMFLASVRDLTERIQVQRQLEKEKELSDSIINSLPGLFYLFQKNGHYLRWNKQLEVVSGYSAEEMSNISPLDFIIEEEVYDVSNAIEKTFQTGHAFIEAHLRTKDGRKIPYYFSGIAINFAGTECLLGTGIDLSVMKNLEKQLSQQKIVNQKKLMQAMIDAEEKEKAKLGFELHDNINQILSVVRMYLTILDSNEVPAGITLPRTSLLLNKAIDEIRNLSHGLAVSYTFEAGLTEALTDMVEKIQLAKDFSITLTAPPNLNEYTNNNQKLTLYRIVQEQLNNILKHAKASEISVDIALTPEEIYLAITDNGKGFDTSKTEKGLGLNNITNRAEALGGKVTIQSAPGKGCKVAVHIPLLKEKE